MTTTTSATTSTYLSVTLSPHLQSELSKPGVWAYEAYFSSTSATPTWTELVSSGAVMNGGTVSAKLTDDINGGKAYFIIESQSASQPANIESLITQQSDLNWANAQTNDFAYDSFEFTLSGGTADQGNLSSVNGFALPMGVVVDYDSGTASATSATVGYAVSGAAIVSAIQNIDSSTMASAIYNYTSGALAGDFRMALSPTEAVALNPQPPIPAFATTDWTSYVTALENVLSFKPPKTPPTIEFSGQFNGAATIDGIWHNSGYFAYQLSWNGTDFLLDPLPTSQIKGEIEIDPADLENSIYATQGSATIVDPTGQTPSFTIGTGVNNQWGTVIRELLTGFTGGFYLQTGKSPNGQVVDLNQNLNWDPTYAFQAQATYQTYDPYSQVFYFNSNSYGSGYSDSLMSQYTVGGPLINLYDPGLGANVKNIDITIYADGDQPSGYTPTSINNYITPPSGSYATPDPNENGSNITLSFFSSVPPNAGIVIASTDTITLNILVPQQNGPPTWSAVTFDGSPSSAGPLGLWQTWQINYDATSNSYSAVPQSPPTQQIAGYMLIDGFPVADSAGSVSWYQLVVGDKTYNLYTTASGGQFENPNYSGQQKALAIDGLATITPEASSAPTIATFNVNFAVGDTVTYDPSLVVLNTANVSSQTMPDAPVAGTILPTGGFPLGAFDALPGQTSATSNTITTSETNLVFAWTGENNNSNTVSWVGAYTNKIDAGQTAVVTITSGTSTTTTSATADIDGRWQTSDTVTLNPGTYTITMAEQLSGSTVAFTPTSDPLILTEIAPDKVVSAGSVSSGAAVSGLFEVRSGGTAVGTSVLGGGTMRVDGGGLASHTTVSGGGKEVVSSGGTASGTIVSGGGVENLFGSETSATIFSGGVQTIVSGGTAVATAVLTGGTEVVGTGATASGTIVSSAGEIDAGSAVRASLLGGSWMSVASGGVASGTTVSKSVLFVSGTASATQLTTGTEIVSSGGTDVGATASAGSTFVVSAGGTASGTVVSSAGEIDAGSGVSTSLLGGTWMAVASGGVASGTKVSKSVLFVSGTASGTQLNTGTEVVSSGGMDFGATASAGSTFAVSAGGTASGTVVSSAGETDAGDAVSTSLLGGSWMAVQAGGVASGTTVSKSVLFVSGTASGTQLNTGTEVVSSGGMDFGATVSPGSELIISAGGIASGTVVSSAGEIDAGSAVSTSLLGGSWMSVASGGVASSTTVSKSVLFVSGIASGTQLTTGTEIVSSGGVDFGATASAGSTFVVSAGGTASGTVVSSAGEIDAGSAVSASLLGGSWMAVQSGGVASGTTVSQSVLFVSGTASATQLTTGTEIVSSGGVDIGAHINSAGFELVSSGGVASSAIISGGTLEVASGGSTGSGAVTFAVSGGGILQLDDSRHFNGLVAGFGKPDLLALTDLSFVSGATGALWSQTTVSSGTLAVTNGATMVDITLLGQYATGNFNVASATGGGTVVSDPPLATQTDPPPGTLVSPH